jgi:hypothetical protein
VVLRRPVAQIEQAPLGGGRRGAVPQEIPREADVFPSQRCRGGSLCRLALADRFRQAARVRTLDGISRDQPHQVSTCPIPHPNLQRGAGVRGAFPLSVVYLTTDVMTSSNDVTGDASMARQSRGVRSVAIVVVVWCATSRCRRECRALQLPRRRLGPQSRRDGEPRAALWVTR